MESLNNSREEITRGKWQWKSHSNPGSKSEEEKWESYSLEHNYLIEKAYYEQQKEVDLGDHIVFFQQNLEIEKGSITSQGQIRRMNWMEGIYEMERSERYFETELPKTINKVFGSLEHFIHFFSKRSPEILEFTKQFNELEKSNHLDGLHHNILPRLVQCIHKELLEFIQEQLDDHPISARKEKSLLRTKKRCEDLILLFKKQFKSFGEFYGHILRAYTMSTSLYRNLNAYLRNENWMKMDCLLPYAFCLCKAFFHQDLNQSQIEETKVSQEPKSIILYRGTAFDEEALRHYKNPEIKNFSWNSVTSTSKSLQQATKFMYKSADIPNNKYPVMFIIESPITEKKSENSRWIDLYQYSALPEENEIILAPGSVFEVKDIKTDENKITTITILLKNENEIKSLAYQGFIMQGAWQNTMMTDREMKMMCLEGEELSEALKIVGGNKLIEVVEFCLCKFDHKTLREMMKVVPTIEATNELKFISCSYQVRDEVLHALRKKVKSWNISKLEIHTGDDFYQVLLDQVHRDCHHWMPLRTLHIDFASLNQIRDEGVRSLASEGLKHLTHLTSLDLNFTRCFEITDEGVRSLASEGLKHLTHLTSLDLNFTRCFEITDEGVRSLASEGLKHLTHLTSLDLNFSECSKITDEGVRSLASEGLKHLTHLTSLNLNFTRCSKITDEGVRSLASEGLKHLTHLTSVNLSFSWCSQITDKGMNDLVLGIKHLTQLKSFGLRFKDCIKITDFTRSNIVRVLGYFGFIVLPC